MRCLILDLFASSDSQLILYLLIALFISWEHGLLVIDIDGLVLYAFLLKPVHLLMSVEVHVAKYVENASLLRNLQVVDQVLLEFLLEPLNVDFSLACEEVRPHVPVRLAAITSCSLVFWAFSML